MDQGGPNRTYGQQKTPDFSGVLDFLGRPRRVHLVRPEGFEPPTNGFGSHYSIRLSYERLVGHYARTAAARVTPATRSLPNGRTPLHCRRNPGPEPAPVRGRLARARAAARKFGRCLA